MHIKVFLDDFISNHFISQIYQPNESNQNSTKEATSMYCLQELQTLLVESLIIMNVVLWWAAAAVIYISIPHFFLHVAGAQTYFQPHGYI